MGNETLRNANKAKNDEFYTQISDIEKECSHYKKHFSGKTIFCNCDDPDTSNFWRYFHLNFSILGLKKLVSTHFAYMDLYNLGDTYKIEYDGGNDSDYTVGKKSTLKENGDFRSEECIKILKEADIVVTNPPFSLFREYVAQLIGYGKKFLIIGNQNNVGYKEIFKYMKENKIWLGVDNGGTKWFQVPQHYEIKTETRIKIENGIKYFSMGNIAWFTNLDHKKRHENIILYRQYMSSEYTKYDNYDAIEVSTYKDIPMDYTGSMGVPITFLDKYNPDQFEIIGLLADKREKSDALIQGIPTYLDEQHKKYVGAILNGKATYSRVIIKVRKNEN
ncbi:putative adenine-specific methylase [Spirochaetia bacterium]|nr:putative adenine-specific methylase [Spirochaetia bacterium]